MNLKEEEACGVRRAASFSEVFGLPRGVPSCSQPTA
jgi:hypothetical protein